MRTFQFAITVYCIVHLSLVSSCDGEKGTIKQESASTVSNSVTYTLNHDALSSMDFTFELRATEDDLTLLETGVIGSYDLMGPFFGDGKELKVASADMTIAERKLVYGHRVPGEMIDHIAVKGGDVGAALMMVRLFFRDNGRMPADASEIIDWNYLTSESHGSRNPANLSKKELFESYMYLVNPVTGRFYDSFEAKPGSPGGLYIHRFGDVDELEQEFRDDRHAIDCIRLAGFKEAWLLRVYRESGTEVLAQKPMPVLTGQPEAPSETGVKLPLDGAAPVATADNGAKVQRR